MLVSIVESNGMSKTALDRIKKFVYSDKCGIILDDYEVHDEIGADTLVGKVMGLN